MLILLGLPGAALATEQIIFGPATYTSTGGPPNEFQETIPLPPALTAPFRLHIQNGNPDGTNRVSSATITLNGTEVASPTDFSQQTAGFDRTVTVQGSNTLQVRLASTTGSFLVLTLFGTVPPPTLTKLEPPTLPMTQGGTGTLTATISAPQADPTTISLQSSAPTVATVPSSATVPATQLTVAIPVAAVAPGTATVTATLNGSSASSTLTVASTGPTLTSLLPTSLHVTQGASGILTITLSAAQGSDTLVTLTSSNASIVSLPPSGTVTVLAGQVSQAFAVFGVGQGTATVTAALNSTMAESQVTVVVASPTVVSLLPPVLPLTEGSQGTLTVTLNASQPTDTEVWLSTSDAALLGLPGDRVIVPAQSLSASVLVTGLKRGTATVTATLNGSTATAALEVLPPPPTLQGLVCPATLTVGATGLCTVSLNATQSTDTPVPLEASDAGVLSVPASVPVPADTLTAQVAVTGLALGSATLTAGPLNGTSQSASTQVLPPPPTIASLTPSAATLVVGATATLTLTLNAVQMTDTPIPLAATPTGIINVPASVTVPAGSLSVPITVTTLAPGSATLMAGPLNGTQAQSSLTVNQLPPTLMTVAPASLTLPKGTAGILTVTLAPTQADPTVVLLTSSDPSVEVPATVTLPAGAAAAAFPVIARSEGTSTLTAGPLNGTSQTATVTVTPAELVTLTITPPAPTIAKGQTQQFTATGTYTDATSRDLTGEATWSSDTPTVATITSPGGLASGLHEGRATLTATVGTRSATATLTVTPPILASLAISPVSPTRAVGETLQFHATGTLTDGSTQDVTAVVAWTSSNAADATITSPGGLATAIAPGSTTVTATHPDGFTDGTTLTVILLPPTLTGFTPSSGKVGTAVTLTGTNFLTASAVRFNGTAVSAFSVPTPTTITTTAPAGATTGPLQVTTSGGTATSTGSFIVLPTQDVSLVVEPSTLTAIAGTSVSLKVSTSASGGFTGLTTLSTLSLPAGVTATFSTPALGPNTSGLLTLTTSGSTPSPATIQVVGTAPLDGSPVTRSATATLAIQPPGPTMLAGQVRDETDQPLVGVTIKLGGTTLTTLGVTDAGGNFLVPLSAAGAQVFLVDGSTANTGNVSYASIPVTATIQPNAVNTLGFVPHLHAQPATQPLPVAPATATPVTFANILDFQLTIPAGVRIIGWDGQPNTQIGLRPVPLDRLAVPPLPAGVETDTVYMFNFGKVGGGVPTQPIPVTLPNSVGAYPGQQVELWYYNEAPDGSAPNAWQKFGTGTVSSDGRLIVSDPGVGIPRFCCGSMTPRRLPPPQNTPGPETAPQPGPEQCPKCGGPIDLASGLVGVEATDLRLGGRVPLTLTRAYRTLDPTVGPFGVGWRHAYEYFVRAVGTDLALLITPENIRARFARQADGTFANTDLPAYLGARLTKNPDNTWSLRFKDGVAWTFNSSGWLTAQRDRNGNTLTITRDSQNRTSRLSDPAGRSLSFTYNGTGLTVQQVTDPTGRSVLYTYDANDRLSLVTDPLGNVTRYTYDGSGRLETITDPRGTVTERNTYDSTGRVLQQVQADGGTFQLSYQVTAGTITQVTETDPNGNKLTYRFNAGRVLTDATDALGQVSRTVRAAGSNLVTSRTDPLGRTTQYTYDSNGNVLTITDALNNTRTLTYDPTFNQILTSTDPLNQITTYGYDAKGNLTSLTDPLSHTTTLGYNATGDLTSVTDALNHTSTFEYDAVGNLTATVDPLGNRTERTYDDVSRLIMVKDPKGAVTQFAYDVLDRLVSVTDAIAGVTRLNYDPNGNLLTVTDARGSTTTHTYDGMNRLASRADALNRTETLTYDFNGNLKTVTDRKNQITTYTYDGQNRRIRTDYADGSSVAFAYDAAGNLLTATDSLTGTITRSYDPLIRLVSEVTPQGAITYTYDQVSRRQTMQASGLQPVTYGYDAASRLTGITQGPQAASVTYDPSNRRTSLVLPNGITVAYTYDEASRLIAQTYTGPSGALGDLSYTYDANGDRIATGGSWARSGVPVPIATSSYDTANQQLQFGDMAMTFDANGNLLTQTDASGTTTYTWDARNRLAAISGPTLSATFAYDALGRRTVKTINGETSSFLYDGLDTVRESGPAGDAAYLRSLSIDEALTRTDGTGTLSYLSDALGSTMALADAAGALPTTYSYAPFGTTTVSGAPSPNPFQFTGRENDGTGLYYYRARYYDAGHGRFLQEDPIGVGGGDPNLFAYVQNRPTSAIDPEGLQAASIVSPAVPGVPPYPLIPGQPLPPEQIQGLQETIHRIGGKVEEVNSLISSALWIYLFSKSGQDKGRNWATEAAKIEAQSSGKTPCDVLDEMLKNAKCEGDTKKVKDIEQAQKFMGCRNIRKRGT